MITARRQGHQIVRNSSFFKKVPPQNVGSANAPASHKRSVQTPHSGLPVFPPDPPSRHVPAPNYIPVAPAAVPRLENAPPGPDGQAEGGNHEQMNEGVDNQNAEANAGPPHAAAYHPPQGMNIEPAEFALPPDIVSRPYDFRPRP